MTDTVDNLSDAELRTKLAEYGFPIVPITNTTRKVMTKKLKMLMENKKKINHENRRLIDLWTFFIRAIFMFCVLQFPGEIFQRGGKR